LGILSFLISLPEPLYLSIPLVVFVIHTLIFLLTLNEMELKDIKRYDVFHMLFFNMTNLYAILLAMFTLGKTDWTKTSHVYKANI
ncbi:MAG: hypothetical protein ACP5QX_07725, partial [Caldisericaceae bacterium]